MESNYPSIFLDFQLPNASTWFYFSLLLVVALFVRFDRFLSLRNWDILSLFVLVPGFLFLQEAHHLQQVKSGLPEEGATVGQLATTRLQIGYIWLLGGTFYLFGRCLFDLGLEKRPVISPNLNLGGLIALMIVLFICMSVVAIRRLPDMPIEQIGKQSVFIQTIQERTTSIIHFETGQTDLSQTNTRFWVERSVALFLHLAVITGLILIGYLHFKDLNSGMAAVCIYLLLPYTAYHISQIHHIWPAVFIIWSIVTYRQAMLSGLILGLATGTVFFPGFLFPLWFGFYRGRGMWQFTFGFLFSLCFSLALTAITLLQHGEFSEYVHDTLALSDWQVWQIPRSESFWQTTQAYYRIPVFTLYICMVCLTIFWPTQRNLGQVIAQSAAILIGVQFWYGDQGGVYVLWYFPLLVLMIFRPSLNDHRPPPVTQNNDYVAKFFSATFSFVYHGIQRLFRVLIPKRSKR